MIDLIRSDETTLGNGKLSHFGADLNKLGTNIAGLNKAAQDAIIAQGIEWYYWQSTDYAGQEFFTQTGALLQYTIAKSDTNADGTSLTSLNKADLYTRPWIQAIAAEHGMGSAAFPAFGTAYDQWNVACRQQRRDRHGAQRRQGPDIFRSRRRRHLYWRQQRGRDVRRGGR